VGRFCLEAVRACLFAWREQPNPRLKEWADIFVKHELARRLDPERAPPWLIALEVSPERVQLTIPYKELFDACARQLARYGPSEDLLRAMHAIGQKVGVPDMGVQLANSIRIAPETEERLEVDQLLETLRSAYKGNDPEVLLNAAARFVGILKAARRPRPSAAWRTV
jgi:hypothetical protein